MKSTIRAQANYSNEINNKDEMYKKDEIHDDAEMSKKTDGRY